MSTVELAQRLEAEGQGSEEKLDVVVGEVKARADEEVLAARDPSRILTVQLPRVHQVVAPRRQDQVIQEAEVDVGLDARVRLERVGKVESVDREDKRIVQQVQLGPEAACVLQDPEPAAEGPVPLGEVRAELELPLGGDLGVAGREERVG